MAITNSLVKENSAEACGRRIQAGQILCAEGISKAYGGQVVLDRVRLSLRRGEVVLLRGDNGSGKTTLLNILTGNVEPDAGVIHLAANGALEVFAFPKSAWRKFNPLDHFTPARVAREGVGRTWQDIRLFSSQTLRDNISVAATGQIGENPLWAVFRHLAVRNREARIRRDSLATLDSLGLKNYEEASADRVSLGQAKRVAIARAVRAGARVLFLDEPLAGLDSQGADSVMELLEALAREEKLTLVIVEHVLNIPRILDLATTVWTLEGGKVKVGSSSDVRKEVQRQGHDTFRAFMQRMAGTGGRVVDEVLPGDATITRVIPAARAGSGGTVDEPLLEVNDLVVYRGKRLVVGGVGHDGAVRGLSFVLREGELSLLQAPNGWGKTTLLEAIAGLVPVAKGSIKLLGKRVEKMPAWRRHKLGASLLQARNHTFPSLTVKESLRMSGVRDLPDGIKPLLSKKAADLSGGEKQKVAMACALNHASLRVALLDEPFSALDGHALGDACRVVEDNLSRSGVLIAVPGSSRL